MNKLMSMRTCLEDENYLGHPSIMGAPSWQAWRVILIAAMGEALTDAEREVFRDLTGGRESEPGEMVEELCAVVGRRGGKSNAIACAGAYLAACVDHRHVLAPGQVGLVPILSASKDQAGEILRYCVGIFHEAPGFAKVLASEPTAGTIMLKSRVAIDVRAANFRRARGFTAVAAIGDEVAYWQSDETSNPDREILKGLRPALGTTGGPLFLISSPYARRGELWDSYRRHFGPDGDPKILVIQAPSRKLNPSLSQRVVDRAYENDAIGAASEYGAEFRAGIDAYISEEAVDPCISRGVFEIPPTPGMRGFGFVDAASGSGGDSMVMAIAYREGDTAILATVAERKPPFNPEAVTEEFAEAFKRYGITRVKGDRWGLGFVGAAFKRHGIIYEYEKVPPKSDLYRELVPAINAGRVRLLDNKRMLAQLLQLERRTGRSGKDSIDHPPNGHDDVINAACGALVDAVRGRQPMVISEEALAWSALPRHLIRPTNPGLMSYGLGGVGAPPSYEEMVAANKAQWGN